MKRLFAYALLVLLMSCGKDDPGFSSLTGVWTYTTPDGKIGVDFELVKNGATWTVVNQVIRVDGTAYKAEVTGSGLTDTVIGSVRINANDPKAVYGYFILFSSGTASGDFRQIAVQDVTYTWPHDKTNTLSSVVINRK